MATGLSPLSPIPTPRQPMVDPSTGLITRDWYIYFQRLDQHIREIEKRIDDLETP